MRITWRAAGVLLAGILSLGMAAHSGGKRAASAEAANAWQKAMRQVHTRFTGRKGAFAQFGDSITVTRAFWEPLSQERRSASPAMETAFETVKARLLPECWGEWKGPEFGSEGGRTTGWAREHIDDWLKKLNPEVALILFGSNDLSQIETAEYRDNLRALAKRCLDHGTVVILSTIPPRHGFEKKAAAFAEAAREVARELHLPLTDLYAEIRKRRPNDWDGALDRFRAYHDYEVPTLIARDGVHPSFPAKYRNDYSEEGLNRSGYTLRNYLALTKVAEVFRALDSAPPVPEASSLLTPPDRPWFPQAPPLPPPTGETIRVKTVEDLYAAGEKVRPGQTILLAEGHYRMTRPFAIKTDNVTLRGETGRRERVILDGEGTLGELITLSACSGVTIADLTVQNVRWNGIKINSETGVQSLRIYHCILHNIWQRAIKGVLIPKEKREQLRPSDFRIEYCLFYNDRPKRYTDDPADTEENFRGNYIGGIDVMFLNDWVISDNVFVGIQGRTHEARGAIFLWHDSQDCLIERNIILDCDSGICLGNSHRPPDVTIHCTNFFVRNNFLARVPENGILADYTRNCAIAHNTIFDPDSKQGRLIRLVHDNTGMIVANNLLAGPEIRNEATSRIRFINNRDHIPADYFVAPREGNLRLTERAVSAIGKGSFLDFAYEDIERRKRTPITDLGAHEFGGGDRTPIKDIRVADADGFRRAMAQARPGTRILLAPGTYRGAFYFSDLHGAPNRPIVIAAADPKNPPTFEGANECLHLSKVSYLELRDLVFRGAPDNGLNIDDGGTYTQPSHHVRLRNLKVSDIGPKGNHDGIKLSGIEDFVVEDCVVERWGDDGSAIDMVGCHRGLIEVCTFRQGGADAIQAKGGSAEITVSRCRFQDFGERGVNIGGSTGLEFFRPPLKTFPPDGKYEARDIRIEDSVFIGGTAPFAFVGVDGAVVRRCTIYHPKRWVMRILQETREPGFVPSRRGRFEDNIVVFRSDAWGEGGVNIGSATAPETFSFARNVWYCEDRPERSKPTLPTPETGALIGKDPQFRNPDRGDFHLLPGSPAAGRGAT